MYSAIGQSQNCRYLYTDFNTYCCEKIMDYSCRCGLVFSCKNDEKNEKIETENTTISFNSKTLEKSLDDCEPEQGECTFISINYPIAFGKDDAAARINKSIQNFIRNTVDYEDESSSKTPQELVDNFIANYQETASEFPEYELPWEATITGKTLFQNENMICLQFNTDMFTGGAHGYRSVNYLNFDAKTGKKLQNTDLFTAQFRDFVEHRFREKHHIPEGSNINSTGMFFENDEFHLPANIGFSKSEVILHYNAYEIAPYAAGDFRMVYPKSEIEQFLKTSSAKKQA